MTILNEVISLQPLTAKNLNWVVEIVDHSGSVAGLTVLMPMDVAVGTFIETGRKTCNELGVFVFEHYYLTNQKIPDIIKKVKR